MNLFMPGCTAGQVKGAGAPNTTTTVNIFRYKSDLGRFQISNFSHCKYPAFKSQEFSLQRTASFDIDLDDMTRVCGWLIVRVGVILRTTVVGYEPGKAMFVFG